MTLNGFAIAVIKLAQREQHVGVVFDATVMFVLNVNRRVPLPITFEATVKVKGKSNLKVIQTCLQCVQSVVKIKAVQIKYIFLFNK